MSQDDRLGGPLYPRCERDHSSAVVDYRVIGDGRIIALVGWFGSMDWRRLPNLPPNQSIFAAARRDRDDRNAGLE